MRCIAVLLAVLVAANAAAQTMPVDVVRVYDGDTITVDADPWPGLTIRTNVRIGGIDTPERVGGCPDSRALALLARDLLIEQLDQAEIITIVDPRHGQYAGRVVAQVLADGRPVSEALLAAGLARPYDGGGRRAWCDAPAAFGPNAPGAQW